MKTAYPKKVRFVDDPIPAYLIPEYCRDEYGIDAVKLTRHLADVVDLLADWLERNSVCFTADEYVHDVMVELKRRNDGSRHSL